MGIPKFYRWTSERYPCLSEVIKEHQIPDFDNLYLDMNGIIHACSHPNDEDPHFRITEEQIFKDIFHYIEVLFRIIQPKKVFFMAVDGVAPRAKQNQQRGRRFQSAKNAEALVAQAKKKGEKLPEEDRFDSNCITPGTPFMVKLQEQLKYFVCMKISSDPMWRGLRIYLSGHNCPGEGEHKIMDFIRAERSSPGYDANTRHCLYGLDADLIMLGLVSHEPHFSLLREEIKFMKPVKNKSQSRTTNAEQVTWHLLHLSLMREYLDFEFQDLKEDLPEGRYELERIIDDWILMNFLVGNDFIPHLPNMHIHSNSLPVLYATYKKVLPKLDGYLNVNGYLNLKRFEGFMKELGEYDKLCFEDIADDVKWLQDRAANRGKGFEEEEKELEEFEDFEGTDPDEDASLEPNSSSLSSKNQDSSYRPGAFDESSDEEGTVDTSDDQLLTASEALAKGLIGKGGGGGYTGGLDDIECPEQGWTRVLNREFKQTRRHYYNSKMHYENITKEELQDQAFGYVKALQWVLHYYYHGCSSWNWHYKHHYAPYISDIQGFANMAMDFELSKAFLPFQQLLAVLPAASKKFLPKPYQELMVDEDSPILDFYPQEFENDLNGKKNDWEAVVLIPFIDEDRLLKAMEAKTPRLTKEEAARNTHGPHLLFTTDGESRESFYPSSLPGIFPDLTNNRAKCTLPDIDIFRIPKSSIVYGLLPGVKLDVFFPGFPTLKHLPHSASIENAEVKVFQANSRCPNMILHILKRPEIDSKDVREIAKCILGEEVHIYWPHLQLAKVIAVSDETRSVCLITDEPSLPPIEEKLSDSEITDFKRDFDTFKHFNMSRRGIEVGRRGMMLTVCPLLGKKLMIRDNGSLHYEKQWSESPVRVGLQTVVIGAKVHEDPNQEFKSLGEAFPAGSCAYLISRDKFYGCKAQIVGPSEGKDRMVLRAEMPPEPDFSSLQRHQDRLGLAWYPGFSAARMVGISSHLFSRITGTVFMIEVKPKGDDTMDSSDSFGAKKTNIGLNLKSNKKGEEVADYTKKTGSESFNWSYSRKVVEILTAYKVKFPEVFDYIMNVSSKNDIYYASDVWGGEEKGKEKLEELSTWLKAQTCYNATRQATGTDTIDEQVIKAIEQATDELKSSKYKTKKTKLAVKVNVLYRSALNQGNSVPDPKADYELYDRVINVREGFTVPPGARGTVIGIHPGKSDVDIRVDVLFDDEFLGGCKMRSSRASAYKLPVSALINISYGKRFLDNKESLKTKDPKGGNERQWVDLTPSFSHQPPRYQRLATDPSELWPGGYPSTGLNVAYRGNQRNRWSDRFPRVDEGATPNSVAKRGGRLQPHRSEPHPPNAPLHRPPPSREQTKNAGLPSKPEEEPASIAWPQESAPPVPLPDRVPPPSFPPSFPPYGAPPPPPHQYRPIPPNIYGVVPGPRNGGMAFSGMRHRPGFHGPPQYPGPMPAQVLKNVTPRHPHGAPRHESKSGSGHAGKSILHEVLNPRQASDSSSNVNIESSVLAATKDLKNLLNMDGPTEHGETPSDVSNSKKKKRARGRTNRSNGKSRLAANFSGKHQNDTKNYGKPPSKT